MKLVGNPKSPFSKSAAVRNGTVILELRILEVCDQCLYVEEGVRQVGQVISDFSHGEDESGAGEAGILYMLCAEKRYLSRYKQLPASPASPASHLPQS